MARCHIAIVTATTGEQELAWPFSGDPQIVIDRLAGLFAQFKSDRPSGFLLPDRCAIRCVSAGSDFLDSYCYDVTAAKLAVDRQIEHRKDRVRDLRSGVSSGSTRRAWVAAVALLPSAFPYSRALAGLHLLDRAWGHLLGSVTEPTYMSHKFSLRNQVGSRTKADFAAGPAKNDL